MRLRGRVEGLVLAALLAHDRRVLDGCRAVTAQLIGTIPLPNVRDMRAMNRQRNCRGSQSILRQGELHIDDCQERRSPADVRALQQSTGLVEFRQGALDEVVQTMMRRSLQRKMSAQAQLGDAPEAMEPRRRRSILFR